MRKPVQIAVVPETKNWFGELFVLADDGTIWSLQYNESAKWVLVPELPQPGADYELTSNP